MTPLERQPRKYLNREEILSCIIALERERKPGAWSKSALNKLLREMGLAQRTEMEK